MIGAVYPGQVAPGVVPLSGVTTSGVLSVVGVGTVSVSSSGVNTSSVLSGVLNVTTSDRVVVTGSIRLTVEAGAVAGRGRPSVDATYLRNFPRHRDGFGRRL